MAVSGGTVVFPFITSLSESAASLLRPKSWQRAKPRNRKHPKKDHIKVDTKKQTALLLHAESVQSCLLVEVIKNGDTSPLVEISPDFRQITAQEKLLLLALEQNAGCSGVNPSIHQPRFPKSPGASWDPRVMQSRAMFSIPLGGNSRGDHGTFSPGWMGQLGRVVSARTAYENDRSPQNATAVKQGENILKWMDDSKRISKRLAGGGDLNKLQSKADSEPGNTHAQTRYMVAAQAVGQSISRRIESRQYVLTPIVIGLYQEAMGFRPLISEKASSSNHFNVLVKGWRLLEVCGKTMGLLLSLVLFGVIIAQLKGAKMVGGPGLGSLLGEDANFEVVRPEVTFEDVAGNEHAVQEMSQLLSFLTEPEKFTEMGCVIPKGYLLSGPPGVGKTLLAKALAGEAGVPFYYTSGSGFEEVFVGVGAGRVRKLFEKAQENTPSIIFIDEIDSIGYSRNANSAGYSNRATLNQILSCMDGFEDNSGVIVIAATNDPQTLDSALTREGRFDSKITIRAPSIRGRTDILKVHCRNKQLADNVDLHHLAAACVGMTGAQLATLVNTAALRAVEEDREEVTQDDLEYSRSRILVGIINEDIDVGHAELTNTAAHEAGHALLTVLREEITKRPVYVTTILPRGNSLGHVQPVAKVDQYSQNIAQIIAQIDIAMAGRVGEELHFNFEKNKVTTGCSSDMQMATQYAELLVKKLGYSQKIGMVKVADDNDDLTEKIVHDEIKKLFDERYEVVKAELMSHKKAWVRLTDYLVRYKTLTGEEVKTILDGGDLKRGPGDLLPSS